MSKGNGNSNAVVSPTIVPTQVYYDLVAAYLTNRYNTFVLCGGTSSSKTYSIIQFLITQCVQNNNLHVSVVSESLPHLKKGCISDFFKIMQIDKTDKNWHDGDKIYTFPNKSKIQFFGADAPSKMRGARRDVIYINECNNVAHESYNQLNLRTDKYTILDYNPVSKFWVNKFVIPDPKTYFHVSTHWMNQHLSDNIRNKIEKMKWIDFEYYRCYGMGQVSKHSGLVFKNYKVTDISEIYSEIIKKNPRLLRYGIDFGYHPDPFTFVVAAKIDRRIYVFKEIVSNELTNEQAASLIKPWCNQSIVWCDSSEPKSIAELKCYGINARGVGQKHRDYGINWLKCHEIIIHEDCKITIEEIENFSRKKDKSGEYLPVFQDKDDHIIDGLVYSMKEYMGDKCEIKSLHLANI